ncbi:ankyrin-2-like [Trichogramma pretiosum]|uniref:ankyrin-2-like n=1 Tax=Trichogramma pretiosum TaxID=7493 RepID=UPI0006C957A3|nr:ankyrin-2-like [Trichogramma pretiosum]
MEKLRIQFYNRLVRKCTDVHDLRNLLEDCKVSGLFRDVDDLNWILVTAIKRRDLQIVKLLVKYGVKINVLEKPGKTAIHIAADTGFDRAVKYLFKNYQVEDGNRTNKQGFTLFHIACSIGNVEMVQKFLDYGVDIDLESDVQYQETPISCAVWDAHIDVVKLLLDRGAYTGCSTNHYKNGSILHYICQFIKYYVDPENHYHTILLEITKLLIQHGCDINAKDKHGNNPILSLFICYPNHNYVLGRKGPLHDLQVRQKEMLEIFLQNGANVLENNKNRETVFDHAINSSLPNDEDFVIGLTDEIGAEIVEMLLNHSGVDVNFMNKNGHSLLQIAVFRLNYDVVKMLLKRGADVGTVKFLTQAKNCITRIEHVINLFGIAELLVANGYVMDQTTELNVIDFFISLPTVSNIGDCFNNIKKDCTIKIRNYFIAMRSTSLYTIDSNPCKHWRTKVIQFILEQFKIFEIGNLNMNVNLRNYLQSHLQELQKVTVLVELDDEIDTIIRKEYENAKKTIVDNQTSFLDIYFMSDKKIYSLVKNSISHRDFVTWQDSFPYFSGIVFEKIVQSIVRNFIDTVASKYLPSGWQLPILCCDNIVKNLKNSDVLCALKAVTSDLS